MKKNKRIVSLITIFSFLLNTMPVYGEGQQIKYYNTSVKSEVNQNAEEITKNILDKVKIEDKVYDGNEVVDADCTQLNEYLRERYNLDIHFTAKGYFDQKNVSGDSNVRVIVKDFLLEGDDADKFYFDNTVEIEKYAKIIKKTVIMKPTVSQCYYGQSIPSEVILTYDQKDIIDMISVPDKVGIKAYNKDQYGYFSVGTYEFKDIYVSEQNYNFEISKDDKFNVLKFEPQCSASGSSAGDMYNEDKCTLSAPEGFLISSDKKSFSSEINVKLNETIGSQSGTVEYFLKNNDVESVEYGAISEMKEYKYFCVCKKPKIEFVEVTKKVNYQSPLNKIFHIGLVSDETIILKAKAQGYYKNDEKYPVFTLYSAKTNDVIASVKGKPVKEVGNSYFECDYELTLPEGEVFEDYEIELTASNDAGEGERTTAVNKDQAVNHLLIDNNPPEVSADDIVITYVNDSKVNCGFFVADGIVNDNETGIAKLEYKWDYYSKYIEYNFKQNSDLKYFQDEHHNHKYYEGARCKEIIDRSSVAKNKNFDQSFYNKNENDKSVHFRILVPYENSYKTPTNRHTLFLKVTDYAGKTFSIEGEFLKENQSDGYDNLEPVIKRINIVSGEEDGKINILPSGNYSNEKMGIYVSGVDRTDSNDYISGLKNFEFRNDQNVTFNANANNSEDKYKEQESIIIIDKDEKRFFTNCMISVIDNGNYEYTNSISAEIKKLIEDDSLSAEDKPDEYLKDMQSDTFIIEDVAPKATSDISSRSAEYTVEEEKVFWFNSKKQKIDFNFSDETSGLNNIILKRGLESVKSFDFSSDLNRTNAKEYIDDISELDTGTYTYSVEMYDNSGNKYSEPNLVKINIDNEAPEGVISASSPDEKIIKIGDQYWTDNEDQFVFTINGTDKYSGVKKIDVFVNGKEFKFNDNVNSYSYIESKSNSQTLKISRSELENQNIKINDDHTYTVECRVTDFAENTSELTSYTLHVDKSDPSIGSVEVKNISNPITGNVITENLNIINLLPFGIFSNTTLTFRVKASDIQYDSGIREIEVSFTDSDKIVSVIGTDSIRYIKEEDCFEFDVNLTRGIAFDKYMKLTVLINTENSAQDLKKCS